MYLLCTKILDNFSTREPTLIRLVRLIVLVSDRINSWVGFQFSA
jgi:hypothetical protein